MAQELADKSKVKISNVMKLSALKKYKDVLNRNSTKPIMMLFLMRWHR